MELMDALRGRYSVRKFSDAMPAREQIEAVLEAGRLAPTARNSQPQRLYVITKPDDLAKIDESTRCRYGAPVCIIIGYSTDEAFDHSRIVESEPWSYGELDATSVLVHMMLKATELGLGTCWLGAFDGGALHRAFDIPESVVIRAILDLGTPAPDCTTSTNHEKRRPLDETVTWL